MSCRELDLCQTPPPPGPPVPRTIKHVGAWLPFLWTRVLFPGRAPETGRWHWGDFCALVVLSGTLLYPSLAFPLFEPDEGRYAQIPREMLERGNWLVPTLQGEPYLDKPPLFYWLVMGAYALFGYEVWAARVVPAVAMHGSILATYVLGRRLVGSRAAWWGAALLTIAPAFLGMGRLLLLDGLLTLWVTLALFAIYLAQQAAVLQWRWWAMAAVCCGLGTLTKGPVALALVVAPLWVHRRLHAAAPIGTRAWLVFAAIVSMIALPWYVVASCALPVFAQHFFWQHNLMRFVQPFDHERPVWFYVPIVLLGLLPVTMLTPWLWRFLVSTDTAQARQRSAALGYLLLAGSWCILFFSLSGSKLPTYILPAFAPLCLAGGCCAAGGAVERRTLVGVVTGFWGLLAAGSLTALPWYAEMRSPLKDGDEVRALCSDPGVPVVCYPRNVDSVAFAVGRSDFRSYRGKQLGELLELLDRQPRVVLLFAHRHSLQLVADHLPPHLHFTRTRPLGLCDLAVVERR